MPYDHEAERNSHFCGACMSHHSGKCPPETHEVWEELADLLIECDRERSRLEWLTAATNHPERVVLAALEYGLHKKEVTRSEDGFWTLVAD